MKKILKWIGIILGSLVGLLVVAIVIIYVISTLRLSQHYDVQPAAVTIPTDAAAIAEGQRQYSTRGCVDCHGADGAGTVPFIQDPLLGYVTPSNLTAGESGVGARYSDVDWVRSIRHGIDPDGKPLLIMPSHEFNPMNDGDLGRLIAYLKTLPAVDTTPTQNRVGPLGRFLLVTGFVTVLPAELIDHDAPRPVAIARGETVEYGHYLAQTCMGCHGQGLSGGAIPGVPSEPPLPRNLTPDMQTGLGSWQEADFVTAIRQGQRPDGSMLTDAMPWKSFRQMTDEELSALWLYLRFVPAKPYGNR